MDMVADTVCGDVSASETETVTLYEPADEEPSVPAITPVELSASPAGSVPEVIDQA
jgi:hypothetical protein